MTDEAPTKVSEIRITDSYILKVVAEEMARTEEKSATKTACRLITERIAIRENSAQVATTA